MSMFEQAIRQKLRFESQKGLLSVEDLWDLPLNSQKAANLDDIAKGLHRQLRDTSETLSFVNPLEKSNDKLQLMFDVVKHIIDVRVAERNAEADARKRRETKQRILELIEDKKDEALRGKSLEELISMANAL